MANASIGGLVSGLDTATIINQLMQLEARPQTMLKGRVSTAERAVTALQTFNAKLANLVTKAAELAKPATWSAVTGTSDNAEVTVTASSAATTGSVTFDVVATALATSRTFTTALAPTDNAAATSTLTVTHDDPSRNSTITLTDTSMQGVAAALNDPANESGLTATLVRAGGSDLEPTYRLVVTSNATGQTSGFTIDDGSGSFLGGSTITTTGRDAEITVNGSPLTSTTNTFTGLMPGADVTLSPKATGSATVTIATDSQALVDKVKALVDMVNTALAEVDSLTATGADPKARGLLSGDSTLRQVRNELLQAVTYGVGGESLAPYGVSTDRSGKLVLDEAKFKAAYEADPTKTAEMFAAPTAPDTTNGLAATVEKIAKAYSNSTDGIVSLAIKSRQGAIRGMQDAIDSWDVRLEVKRNALQRQYTALESALGKLQSQGNWLAGQIASLPQMSSGQ